MGLGPPVCTDCKLILKFLSDEEYSKLRKSGVLRPNSYHYICSGCKAHSWFERPEGKDYFTTRDDPSIKHLFLLSEKEQEEYLRNTDVSTRNV